MSLPNHIEHDASPNIALSNMHPWVDPKSQQPLHQQGDAIYNSYTDRKVAEIVGGIPRFVKAHENYSESFGWQWKKWEDARSDQRNNGHNLKDIILQRTHFLDYDLEGKSLLECGMGGGDDTEILLQLPLGEIHSFDISTSVERAAKFLKDPRLTISQASILDIPYSDESFDIVYCHRVLQHTPNPAASLRSICAKVKRGGILFAHSYKRSWRYMSEWRYKYRWLTKRLPHRWVFSYVDACGPFLHHVKKIMANNLLTRAFSYQFIPFYWMPPASITGQLSTDQQIELEKCITFDALTPWHDHPMTSKQFRSIIEAEGFEIQHIHDPKSSPIYCTAVRK